MAKIKTNFYENNLFSFESYSCTVYKGQPNYETSEIETLIVKQNKNNPVVFAFSNNNKGLVRIDSRGQIIEDNLLGKLISVNDENALIEFITKNGFIFPITTNSPVEIKIDVIWDVITRLRATIEILNQIGNQTDIYKMLNSIMYLIYSYTENFDVTDIDFMHYKHSFKIEIEQTDRSQDINREQEIFQKGSFQIADTLHGNYEFENNLYVNIMNGYSETLGHDDENFMSIVHYYANKPSAIFNHRKIVDFLFHFQMRYGVLRNYRIFDGMGFFQTPSEEVSTDYQQHLIDVAKIVVAEEINSNISNVRPEYDQNTMEPKWKINSLLAALSFSIFYLNPELELYRRCVNPNCQQYFIVKTTATKKKYCCIECSNAVQQAKFRKRHKKNG